MTQLREGTELHAEELGRLLIGPNKNKLIVLMGLPASGKSALCEFLEKLAAVRVNRDAIRKRLYGDEAIYGDYKVVNAEYYRELKEALAKGGIVVSDNVNTTIYHRKGTIAAAREAGYTDITIVWLDVPLEVCLERNAARERKVKEDVMRSMAEDLKKDVGPPRDDEGSSVVIGNGKDREHYTVNKVRIVAPAAPAPTTDPVTPAPLAGDVAGKRLKFAGDLRVQLNLLDACLAASRDPWALEALNAMHMLIHQGSSLFAGDAPGTPPAAGGATTGGEDKPEGDGKKPRAPRPKKPWIPPTPEEVNETLLKMIGDRPVVTREGPLVMMSFNGYLLDKEKAERLILPLTELFKRAHIIFVQESNVDALRVLAKSLKYGLNVSHRNKRQQACGILFHPRLHWLGSEPEYHDYLLDVPGHPEYKETMRPVVQRRVRDMVTGWVFDVLNFHGKSNLGGPDATRPIRRWQFEQLVAELEKQKLKSPWSPRAPQSAPAAADGKTVADAGAVVAPTSDAAKPHALVENTGEDLPLGPVILGGDFNAPIEKPETTEIEPLTAGGFVRVSTPDLRWSYQYRGSGGQFDGFFVRGVDVAECFIPMFPDNKRDAAFYKEVSDHLPVFIVVNPPVAQPAATANGDGALAEIAATTAVSTAAVATDDGAGGEPVVASDDGGAAKTGAAA